MFDAGGGCVLALQLESVFSERAKEKQIQSGGAVIQKSEQPPIVAKKESLSIVDNDLQKHNTQQEIAK